MIQYRDPTALLKALILMDDLRINMENHIQEQSSITCYCAVCGDFKGMSIRQFSSEWIDLRSEAVCVDCGSSSRTRLLFDAIMSETPPSRQKLTCLLFERITPFHDVLAAQLPLLSGVEFGGAGLESGSNFIHRDKLIRHEDMQDLSFYSNSLDLVVHSDVLEHVPDPIKGMTEIHRVLRPGGKCIFACPIYSVLDHRKRAEIANGELIFLDGPCFHGDPLREEGVPVFYEFGLSLIDDLNALGFRSKFLLDHSLTKGYFSNNNPWRAGHMWPLVVVCEKNKH